MHALPRRILGQLLTDFGPALLNDPARLDALLADLWGPYHCERFLLVHSAKLLAQSQSKAVYGQHFPQNLQKRYGFSAEAAQWAFESWFTALDLAPLQPNTSRDGSHTAFSEASQRALRQLLTDYGPALLEDPARVHALLADLSGQYSRERFLLVQALREHIPAELLVQHQDDTDQLQQLSQRFQRRYGFSSEAARWAIESWSLTLKAARSGQDPSIKEDREAAKAIARQLATERDAARETARQKAIERAAAETVARQKAEELAAALEIARHKAQAEASARQKAQAEEIAQQKCEEVKEIMLQILEFDPLTPSEVAMIFGIREKQAITWLSQLRAAGKIEETWLKRPRHYPTGFQIKERSSTSTVATYEDKRAAGVAARQKVKDWRTAEASARKFAKERAAAESKTQQLAKERAAAESAARKLAKERAAAESAARKLAKERAAAESATLRLAKKLAIAKTTVQQLARKQAAAEKAARLKSKEWSSAAAAARKMVKKRTKAEAMARKTEEKSVEIILQNLKQNSLTSREAAAVLKTEQEQAIALIKRLLSDNQIEITWSKRSPYAPCYQPAKHATTPTLAKEQSPPRQSGCLWLWALPGLLGLLAVLG